LGTGALKSFESNKINAFKDAIIERQIGETNDWEDFTQFIPGNLKFV
jgi:hypothetical protein